MFSFIVFLGIAIWIFQDAKKRGADNGTKMAILTAIFGALAAPFYFAQRPLLEGETRDGGKWWNVSKWFAMFWTIAMGIALLSGLFAVGADMDPNMDDYEAAGTAIGVGLGIMLYAVLWFGGMITALVVGMLAKKDEKETGPTA